MPLTQYCGKLGVFVMRYGKPSVVENIGNIEGISEMPFYNGKGVIKFEIDHIRPVFKGGQNIIDNLLLSCRLCNRGKKDRERENGGRPDVKEGNL